MRVGICAVLEFQSEEDMETELPKFAKGRDYYFPKAEFVADINTGPTSSLTLIIYASEEEADAENNAWRKYIASVRHHVRDVFSYEGSLKYLFNRLPIGDHL